MTDIYSGSGIRVDGARELRRALKKAGIDLKDEIKAAHRGVADKVITRARTTVPIAPASMTTAKPGLLRDSLRSAGTQTAAIARAGKKRVPYAGPIQWGWHRRNIRPSLFLTRAAADTEPEWVKDYEERFDKIREEIENSTNGVNQNG
ncbi:putative phage protein [Corynebacterium striatum]|nr:putative phage protein [Corynebacterium striatum]